MPTLKRHGDSFAGYYQWDHGKKYNYRTLEGGVKAKMKAQKQQRAMFASLARTGHKSLVVQGKKLKSHRVRVRI